MHLIREVFKRIDPWRITYGRSQQTPFARIMIASPSKEKLTDNNTSENDGTKVLGSTRICVFRAIDLPEQQVYGTANL